MEAKVKGGAEKFRFLRPRTFYYTFVLGLVSCVMLYSLIARPALELHVLHDRNPVFVMLSSGEIRNGYTLKILNKTYEHKTYTLSVDGLPNAQIDVKAAGDITKDNLYVAANSVGTFHVNIRSEIEPSEKRDIQFVLTDNKTEISDSYDSVFISKRER